MMNVNRMMHDEMGKSIRVSCEPVTQLCHPTRRALSIVFSSQLCSTIKDERTTTSRVHTKRHEASNGGVCFRCRRRCSSSTPPHRFVVRRLARREREEERRCLGSSRSSVYIYFFLKILKISPRAREKNGQKKKKKNRKPTTARKNASSPRR